MKDCYIFTLACVVFVLLLFFNNTYEGYTINDNVKQFLINKFLSAGDELVPRRPFYYGNINNAMKKISQNLTLSNMLNSCSKSSNMESYIANSCFYNNLYFMQIGYGSLPSFSNKYYVISKGSRVYRNI